MVGFDLSLSHLVLWLLPAVHSQLDSCSFPTIVLVGDRFVDLASRGWRRVSWTDRTWFSIHLTWWHSKPPVSNPPRLDSRPYTHEDNPDWRVHTHTMVQLVYRSSHHYLVWRRSVVLLVSEQHYLDHAMSPFSCDPADDHVASVNSMAVRHHSFPIPRKARWHRRNQHLDPHSLVSIALHWDATVKEDMVLNVDFVLPYESSWTNLDDFSASERRSMVLVA